MGTDLVLYIRLFFFNDTATTEIYTLSLHDALPISESNNLALKGIALQYSKMGKTIIRSEEHTSELQSPDQIVCRLLLEKKKDSIQWTQQLLRSWFDGLRFSESERP